MADQAVGRNCPNDGTLTACAGAYADENLVGTCAYCNQTVSTPNPYYSKPSQPATDDQPASDAEWASDQQAASIHNYADIAPAPVAPEPVVEDAAALPEVDPDA
jgi:hypothetical protein